MKMLTWKQAITMHNDETTCIGVYIGWPDNSSEPMLVELCNIAAEPGSWAYFATTFPTIIEMTENVPIELCFDVPKIK